MYTSPSETDEEIALRVQKGERELFGVLVERYEKKMLTYARKFLFDFEDAEDIAQEVFIKAYINIRGFDAKRKFSSWLYRIAHNEFINAIKKRKRRPVLFFDFDTMLPHIPSKEKTDKRVLDDELTCLLDTSLNKLDPKYREPLVLHYFEELDYKEISEIMHIPLSTVGVRLRRAKKILRMIYTRDHI